MKGKAEPSLIGEEGQSKQPSGRDILWIVGLTAFMILVPVAIILYVAYKLSRIR